jgi:hypothetical protein
MILTIKLQNEHNRKSGIRFKTNNNDIVVIKDKVNQYISI